MGDSEEEYDRRREKFRRERSDIYERRGERDWSRERPRGWSNGGGGAPDMKRGGLRPPPSVPSESIHRRREYPAQPPHDIKRRFSPGREAEMRARKRMRGYEPAFEGVWGPAPGWDHPGSVRPAFHPPEEWAQGDRVMKMRMEMEKMGQRMLTFKQWLHSQPDDISDEDAIKNYTEYKISYKRQQLQDFFIAHKDEEWFKEKYHPDDSNKREKEHRDALKRRADVFKMLVDSGLIDQVSLDLNNENQIIMVLDSAVIFMEGGNEDDLKILDEIKEAPEAAAVDTGTAGETKAGQEEGEVTDDKAEDGELNEEKKEPFKVECLTEEQHELKKQAELYKQLVADKPEGAAQDDKSKENKKKKKKRDREYRGYDDDGEGTSSSSGSSSSDSSSSSSSDEDGANEKKPTTPEKTKTMEEAVKKEEDMKKVEEKEPVKEPEVVEAPKPRALHRTYSIFMRNLPPSVTRNDIVNLCKKFPGFIRVAFSQPLEDHNRFIRRCWVTFDRSVNIKDICWNLNNTRLRDLELNPVVNRDLARRVRPISGIAQHKSCARNDLKNIVRLIMHLDEKSKIWIEEEKESEKAEPTKEAEQDTATAPKEKPASAEKVSKAEDSTSTGKNPWLENISEFLVDESSAEEDELLGAPPAAEQCEEGEDAGSFETIQRHGPLLQQVDRLLYYLRLVHSVDYYNASQYPNEDEMPNRCGIIHARGPIPPNKLTKEDINEFQKRFNDKLLPILTFQDKMKKEDAAKLGIKEVDIEVEKFVTANTQELGKDKWLCPLSGKKFKGPDYIRKHIFNKHIDKVESVKNDVLYFNNYLMDPGRPGPPEGQRPGAPGPPGHPGSGPPHPSPMGSSSGYGGGGGLYGGPPPMFGDPGRGQFSTPQFHHRPPSVMYNNGRTYPPKQRDMRPRDAYAGRPIVEYRDLDAPDDADFF